MIFDTAASERMRITSGGNVGIGTTSASYKLQVYNGSNGTSAAFGGTEYGVRIDNGGTFSSGRSTIYGVNSTFYGSYQPLAIGASILYFSTYGTDRAVIDDSGNMGIGTTSPSNKLHVVGTSQISSYTGIGVAPDSSTMVLVKGTSTSSANFAAVFQNSAGTNLVRFFNNGKVNFGALPTSSAGLSSGDLWNDGGTLKIV